MAPSAFHSALNTNRIELYLMMLLRFVCQLISCLYYRACLLL